MIPLKDKEVLSLDTGRRVLVLEEWLESEGVEGRGNRRRGGRGNRDWYLK